MTTHLLGFSLLSSVPIDPPLTSILGAIGDAIMIFWRQVVGLFRRIRSIFVRE